MGIQDYKGYIVKLGGYLPAVAATGGVRHSPVDSSTPQFQFFLREVMSAACFRRQTVSDSSGILGSGR
jgi:hypothetical protein